MNLETIVRKISVTMRVLARCQIDPGLRQLALVQLMGQSLEDGLGIIIPEGMRYQITNPTQYQAYREALWGLTLMNIAKVRTRLVELGIGALSLLRQIPLT